MDITVTSRTGTVFSLTLTATADVTATAKGLELGGMDFDGSSITARFPATIGGQRIRVSADFDGADAAKVAALFAEAAARRTGHAADEAEYDRRHSTVNAAMTLNGRSH